MNKSSAQDLLSDTIALGVAIRSQSEVASRRLTMQVTVVGVVCDFPSPAEVSIEVKDLPYSLNQLEKISIHKNDTLPRLEIYPKSLEVIDEVNKVSSIVGSLDLNTYASLHESLGEKNLDPNNLSLDCNAHIFPKTQLLDCIAEMTSDCGIGHPAENDVTGHLDRLYGNRLAKDLLPPPESPVSVKSRDGSTISLNTNQSRAVHEVVMGAEALIVSSPPGSGKTLTAVVMARLVDPEKNVFMCSVTNSSVKNMSDVYAKLEESEEKRAVRMVSLSALSRMGKEDRSAMDLREQLPSIMEKILKNPKALPADMNIAVEYISNLTSLKALDKEISESSGSKRAEAIRNYVQLSKKADAHILKACDLAQQIQHPNVVMCTIDHAVKSAIDAVGNVGVLIIDESSQVTEAQLLCLIQKAPNAAIILIGDPEQLDPHKYDDELQQKLAGRSALVVAQRNGGFAKIQLDQVYRAFPSLTNLYSKSFYNGGLNPVRVEGPEGENVLVRADLIQSGDPFMVIDLVGSSVTRDKGHSLRNEAEAALALKTVERLISEGVQQSEILVICFYAYQQSLLRRTFAGSGHRRIEVLTVDSAQGRERKVVLLLTTRVKGGKAPFFNDRKRINVALSRQADALIVFAKANLLRELGPWKTFMALVDANDAVRHSA